MDKKIKYSFIVFGMLLLVFIPESLIFQNHVPLCIFKYATGVECPFCGMTRACFNIMHLHLSTAFSYNPVSLMLPLMLITEAGYDLVPSRGLEILRRAVMILFVALLAVLFLFRLYQYFHIKNL